jgi:hypothetical protein
MNKGCLLAFGGLVFISLLSCRKANEILPENARLKQVMRYIYYGE